MGVMLGLSDTATQTTDLDGPAGRIVAQRGLFVGPNLLVPEDLYARVERGAARRERNRVELGPATAVSTNTYFGRFHATYWQRWTAAPDVEVELVAAGSGRVRLMASDTNKVWRIVDAAEVDGAQGTVRLVGPIDRFVDGGGMWLELTTETGELTVSDVRWRVTPSRSPAPTDVVICTYNRVADCLKTLTALGTTRRRSPPSPRCGWSTRAAIRCESRLEFAEIATALAGRLRYVRQPNLGGSGGFTRGMFDATAGARRGRPRRPAARRRHPPRSGDPPPAHGVRGVHDAPDDRRRPDAQPPAPRATCTSPPSGPIPSCCGSASRCRTRCYEAYLLGLDERMLPIGQERRVDTEYNGWWACLIPATIIRAIGYPLPLFFQWDDIEFGYRARAHGFPTVALPGAGVWHADFGWKDWDEWHRYFNMRNGLITAALHTGFSTRTDPAAAGHAAVAVPRRDALRAGRHADQGGRGLPRRA